MIDLLYSFIVISALSALYCFSVKRTEHMALKVLREQLFVHKSDLISAFQEFDKEKTGTDTS